MNVPPGQPGNRLLTRGRRWALAAAVAWSTLAAAAGAQSVWELSPYQVRLVVVLAPGVGSPEREAELGRQLVARCDALVGAAWDTEAGPAPAELFDTLPEQG